MQTANGKAILFGEHFVVYRTRALAIALVPGATATTTESGAFKLTVPAWDFDSQANNSSSISIAFNALTQEIRDAGYALSPVHVSLDCHLPPGAGLGSSGALGVATARALLAQSGHIDHCSPSELHKLVLAWEAVFHGNPSGFDHAVSMREGAVIFDPEAQSDPFQPIHPGTDLHFVISVAEPGASTSAMVAGVAEFRDEHTATFAKLRRRADRLVEEGIQAFAEGHRERLGTLMSDNHKLLQQIGVSTPTLDSCVDRLRSRGTLGAKLTGAGGGGAVIGLARSEQHQAEVVRTMQELGFETISATVPAASA
jgi:mevalonate kinase